MTTIQQELESFRQFATAKIQAGESIGSIDDLYDQWREDHASPNDVQAIAASLNDMATGETGRDFQDFAADFCRRNGLADQP